MLALENLVITDGDEVIFVKDIPDKEKRRAAQFQTLAQGALIYMMSAGEIPPPECVEIRYVLDGLEHRVHMKKPREK